MIFKSVIIYRIWSLMSINQRMLNILFVPWLIGQLFLQVSDGVGELSKPEVSIHVSSVSSLRLDLIAWDVQKSPDLEDAVDEAKWADSQGFDKGADWDAIDENEDPEQDGRIKDVMQDLSTDKKSARAVADTEADHLDEGKNDCEDMKRGHEDLNESYEQKRHYDDSLALHHERSPSVFLKELSWEERDDDLKKVEIDEDGENACWVVVSHGEEGNVASEVAKRRSSW